MNKNLLISSIIIFTASLVFAHGEDKFGPHKGYVRMPGAFHTEVLKDSKNSLRVYLLDINWTNPSIKDSSVEATIKNKQSSISLKCEAEKNSFICSSQKGELKLEGTLEIMAKREGQVGAVASYPLPFKLEAPKAPEQDPHQGHH